MKWRLFNLAAAVSLVLCVATAILWGRSFWRKDRVSCFDGHSLHLLVSRHGRFGYEFARYESDASDGQERTLRFSAAPAEVRLYSGMVGDIDSVRELDCEPSVDLLGIELSPALGIFFIPHWVVVLLLAIIPACRGPGVVRQRFRHARRMCPGCGYDLRATPQRCPECGCVVAQERARDREA